jgi:hypothetical protein
VQQRMSALAPTTTAKADIGLLLPNVSSAGIGSFLNRTRAKSVTRLPRKDWHSAAFGAVVVTVLDAMRILRSRPAGCAAEVGLWW